MGMKFNFTVGQLVWVENNYQINSTSYVNFLLITLFSLKLNFARAFLRPFFGYFTPFPHIFRTLAEAC